MHLKSAMRKAIFLTEVQSPFLITENYHEKGKACWSFDSISLHRGSGISIWYISSLSTSAVLATITLLG